MAETEHPPTMGERIAQERRQLGVRLRRDVTPADLAKLMEVNPATVYRWESNEKAPREDALAKLATLFDTTPAYLRYGMMETTTPSVGEGDIPPGHTLIDREEAARQAAIDRTELEKRKHRKAGGQ